jgi:hypothetical protein
MTPVILFYINLLLCGIVFLELLLTYRKNSILKLYFLLIVASLITMNFFAIAGITTRTQFIFAKFMRFVYVCGILLVLIQLAYQKIPRWFTALVVLSGVTITGIRLAYYEQINIQALTNPNHVFAVGAEFYTPQTGLRYLVFALVIVAIIVAYSYYRRLLMKLDMESAHYNYLSGWIISLVVPFFLLTIFGILGNLQMFNETVSSYLFAIFSCASICSFVLRPRFLDEGLQENSSVSSNKPRSAVVV